MAPARRRHGKVAMRIGMRLGYHVEQHGLGEVYAAETGFHLASDPDTVRAPDVSFLRLDRVEESGDVVGYSPGAPDLAVEVLSPGDRFVEVEEKVLEWLDAGTRMVVVVNPEKRTATVYRSRTEITVLAESDLLDGADVVPGWRLPVHEMFA